MTAKYVENTGAVMMNRFLASLIIIIGLGISCRAKEWRGIVPLHSTRSDVEKLIGAPKEDLDGILVLYRLPDVMVDIQYAANPKCQEDWPYDSWNVPKGTVTFIRVAPRKHTHLTDLNLDLAKFVKEHGDSDVVNHFYYIDEAEGFSLSVHEIKAGLDGIIGAFVYGPTTKDDGLRCKRGRFRFAPPTISFRSA